MPLKPDYGIDAPAVLRNLLLFGTLVVLLGFFGPTHLHLGPIEVVKLHSAFRWMGGFLLVEGLLYFFYVKVGKFHHRDAMLAFHAWNGNEEVLDVGCGRGLLLAGAAKRLTTGHATGIDVWSTVDMSGNSPQSAQHNLNLEGIASRCTLVSVPAQEMPFSDATFDVIVSNLCLHNISDAPTRRLAVQQIVRVLRPGGTAIISDYKRTGEYAQQMREAGLNVQKKRGNVIATFPPLAILIA